MPDEVTCPKCGRGNGIAKYSPTLCLACLNTMWANGECEPEVKPPPVAARKDEVPAWYREE